MPETSTHHGKPILYLCRKCSKPDPRKVDGKARSGKRLLQRLRTRTDLPVEVRSCGCLGKCKKGPNGRLSTHGERLHHLTVKTVRRLSFSLERES